MAPTPANTDLVHPIQTRAVIYLWDSPAVQAVCKLDLAAQQARCSAWVAMQGWPAAQLLADTTPARPALAQLRALVRDRQCDVVLLPALASLGPQVSDTLALLETIARQGIDLVSLHESFDTTSAHGSFALLIIRALAQIALPAMPEPRSGIPSKPRPDRRPPLPFGYLRANGGVAADPATAPIVRRIFMLRDAGATLPELVQLLRAQLGRSWNQQAVAEVLANEPAYRGGQHSEGWHWPALLEER